MSFELREHTADVAVEATGPTLGAAFAATADGMAAAMCDRIPEDGDRFDVSVSAESREALLFDYLDELIYERDVREVLPVDNEATVERSDGGMTTERSDDGDGATDGMAGTDETVGTAGTADDSWRLRGSARGVPFAEVEARDLKAVTYSEMVIEETDDGWRVYVVFDV